jgi:Tol biopolymer transport system component
MCGRSPRKMEKSGPPAKRKARRRGWIKPAALEAALAIVAAMTSAGITVAGESRLPSDTGIAIRWAPLFAPSAHTVYLDPVWSADGKFIYFWQEEFARGAKPMGPEVMRFDLASGELRQVARGRSPDISSDGRWLLFRGGNDDSLTLKDLESDTETNIAREAYRPAWVGAGQFIYYLAPQHELRLVHVPGLGQDILMRFSLMPSAWRLAPDGALLAVCVPTGGRRPEEIRVVDVRSHRGLKIAEATCRGLPVWSPDSQLVAFAASRQRAPGGTAPKATRRIYLYDVKAASLRLLTDGPNDYDPVWSPDGTRLTFARQATHYDSSRDCELLVYDCRSQQTTTVATSRAPILDIAWSPDGRWLSYRAYATVDSGHKLAGGVGLVRSDGSLGAVLTHPPLFPVQWSPNSSRLTCLSLPSASAGTRLWLIDVTHDTHARCPS